MSHFEDLLCNRDAIDAELKRKARDALIEAADEYIAIFGNPQGVLQMGEDLCRVIAPQKCGPGGWDALLRHLIRISG